MTVVVVSYRKTLLWSWVGHFSPPFHKDLEIVAVVYPRCLELRTWHFNSPITYKVHSPV